VLCALKLGKPTLAIGYAKKNDVLMAEMGLDGFCQEARAIDVDRLVTQFASWTGARRSCGRRWPSATRTTSNG